MADSKMKNQDQAVVEFAAIPWESPTRGMRVKQVLRGDQRIRLIEFSEQLEEADWCRAGHIGFVIDGTLDIDFDGRVVKLKAGDALFIPPGDASKHKARVPRGTATLFVVESAESADT